MLTVCLTGGIGSGKTTVSDLFEEHGVDVIDTDEISRALTGAHQGAVKQIAARFGNSVVREDGSLDRDQMRSIVFSDNDARRDLQNILHPLIRNTVRERLERLRGHYALVVVPLLMETRGYEFADRILVVDCEEEKQIERVMRRSGLTRDQVMSIMKSQATRSQRLEAADDVIHNDGDVADLRADVSRLHARYLKLANRAE